MSQEPLPTPLFVVNVLAHTLKNGSHARFYTLVLTCKLAQYEMSSQRVSFRVVIPKTVHEPKFANGAKTIPHFVVKFYEGTPHVIVLRFSVRAGAVFRRNLTPIMKLKVGQHPYVAYGENDVIQIEAFGSVHHDVSISVVDQSSSLAVSFQAMAYDGQDVEMGSKN